MIAQGGTQFLGLYDFKRQLDAFGGVDYFRESLAGGYLPNARVMLGTGEIVQNVSGVNRTNDPNVDMTGWKNKNEVDASDVLLEDIDDSIKKNINKAFHDQLIDVTWFGAKGDWDKNTQTGTDDTIAVQNAINYLARLPTRRGGGKRGLKFPKGSYLITSILFPESLGFGLDIIGDGVKTTNLYFDHTVLTPAMTCNIEFLQFRNMSLIGAKDEAIYTTRTDGFVGKLPNNYPDIDVTFFNCEISYWNTFAKIHGRGCNFESCGLGMVIRAMDIVCSDNIVHGADTDNMQSKYATMRHYTFRNCRFDNVSRAYVVSGTGFMLDYINNVVFVANDITNMDILVDAPTATICSSTFLGNTAIGSFATKAFQVKTFKNTNVHGNNFCKLTNANGSPSSGLTATEYFIDATAPFRNLSAIGNTVKGISKAFIRNTATQESESVLVLGNILPEFGTYKAGNTSVSLLLMSGNCKQLAIFNNIFNTSVISGTYYLFNQNLAQLPKDVSYNGNSSSFIVSDELFSFTPKLYVGVSQSDTLTTAYCRYKTADNYVHARYFIGGTASGKASDAINIDLPVPSIRDLSAYSNVYAGFGKVINSVGISSVSGSFFDAQVNSSNQRLELRKQKDMIVSNITQSDIPATFSVVIDVVYRFK